jgi:hypothetical protein
VQFTGLLGDRRFAGIEQLLQASLFLHVINDSGGGDVFLTLNHPKELPL